MQTIQSVLALVGVGMIAHVIRWQIAFCTLESVTSLSKRADILFTIGVVLVAQRYMLHL